MKIKKHYIYTVYIYIALCLTFIKYTCFSEAFICSDVQSMDNVLDIVEYNANNNTNNNNNNIIIKLWLAE